MIKDMPLADCISSINHHHYFVTNKEQQKRMFKLASLENTDEITRSSDIRIIFNIRSDGKVEIINGNNRCVTLLLVKPDAKIKDINPKHIRFVCLDNDKLAEMTVPSVVNSSMIGNDFFRHGPDDRGKWTAYVSPNLRMDDER